MNKGIQNIKKYSRIYKFEAQRDRAMYLLNRLIKKNVFRENQRFEIKKTHAGNRLLERKEANDYLREKIIEGAPFLCGRFGSVEAQYLFQAIEKEINLIEEIPKKFKDSMYNNAGYFSIYDNESAKYFVDLMKDAIGELDLIGYWWNGMQEYLIDNYGKKNIKITKLTNIHPYDYERIAWTSALEGKKVLVIHPFAETIEKQFKVREKIWKRKDILPDFDLKTLKAVQTIAGEKDDRFEKWEDALTWMYEMAIKIDFDLAIIGCGAYGLPLGAKLKKAGKQAIHLGGVTQALFGIKGGRFDDYEDFQNNYYNEYWVRPSLEETPKNFRNVEGGCYW